MKRLLHRTTAACLILTVLALTAAISLYIQRNAPRAMRADSIRVSTTQEDPVTRFRTEREALRSRQTGQLNDIIHSDAADADTVNRAQRQLMDLMKTQETELNLEGILNARGFEDALVTVSEGSVNVILRTEPLTRRESAVILDLILRETGVTAGNVKILSINQ